MPLAWHAARPVLRAEIEEVLREVYLDLSFDIIDGVAVVRGSFPVTDLHGDVITRFSIEIAFPDNYPVGLPVVRETGGRIPHIPDRHINFDGAACLIVPDEWQLISDDRSFRMFMAGPVANFFLGQALVELGQPWPFGERSHGLEGMFEAYGDFLGTSGRESVRRYLEYLSRPVIKGHWDCPCGSGKVLRRCHLDQVRALQKRISPTQAKQLITNLATHGG